MTWSRTGRALGVAVAAAALLVPTATAAGAAHGPTTVTRGLVGPLGLAVEENGTAYVGEAFAGALTEVDKRGVKTSLVSSPGVEIAGVHADGHGVVTYVTSGGEGADAFARLMQFTPNRGSSQLADLAAYEARVNPDGGVTYGFSGISPSCAAQVPAAIGGASYTGIVESHPYAVTGVPGGHVVADAAANALLRVSDTGTVTTLAVLPPQPLTVTEPIRQAFNAALAEGGPDGPPPPGATPPSLPACVVGGTYAFEPVPTDVELGRDGLLYVTTLAGGPESPALGARSSVYRVHPRTGALARVATGFAGATDLAIAPNGRIFVSELFGGRISRLTGSRISTVATLPGPTTVEWARGRLYATTFDAPFGSGPPVASLVTLQP